MSTFTPFLSSQRVEMTQKEFWISAYLAALHRLDHAAALKEADQALLTCNKRWQWPHRARVEVQHYLHDCPIGFDEEGN